MKSTGIIISGSTGYIGSNLVSSLKSDKLLLTKRVSNQNSTFNFFNTNNEEVKNLDKNFDNYIFVHLATHYSKNKIDNNKIKLANIDFGVKVLNQLSDTKLLKIIYTNTMFTFYNDEKIRNLYYTNTKNEFAEKLEIFTNDKKIYFDEIFLDNTFGGDDNRKKIVQLISESIINKSESPIKNESAAVNIIYFQDVVKRLINSINNLNSNRSIFVNPKSVKIKSIENFLKNYYLNGEIDIGLLKYTKNDYQKNHPENFTSNIQMSSIDKKLIEYFDLIKLNKETQSN